MNVQPIIVSYRSPRWIRIAVNSYRHQWPGERVLIVDNNAPPGQAKCDEEISVERQWLRSHPGVIVISGGSDRSHGAGMDVALDWCRTHYVDVMLCFEPDCVITGQRWRDRLLSAIEGGADMAGMHRYAFGPIHPCPSAWRISVDWPSFTTQSRTDDERHPRFQEFFDLPLRLETARQAGPRKFSFWSRYWDAAQRAWFRAAVRDKAAFVPKEASDGFKHYWKGSSDNRNHSQLAAPWSEYVVD